MQEGLLILTGSRHDDEVLVEVAAHLELRAVCCTTVEEVCEAVGREAGALVITEEACGPGPVEALASCLAQQPPWSDLPVIALTSRRVSGTATQRQALFDRLGHVTLLQRPLRWETLLSAVAAAVRSRRRQHVLADHMARLSASAEHLEDQVRQRTRTLRKTLTQLQETQQQLVESQRMEAIGQLTGGVAHDFNNLLQVVNSSVTLAQRAQARPELQHKALTTIKQATARGSKLTQQLLAFASRQPLVEQTVDLASVMAAFGEFLERAVRQEIRLTVHAAPGTWPVTIDVAQLEMSVMNLVVNAQDAIHGPGTIDVAVANADEPPPALAAALASGGEGARPADEAFVCIEVRDSGSGMSEDTARQAFEPFFTTKAPAKGTGLGLSQVYGFARQSGGAAAVLRTGSTGTTIGLWLPRAATTDRPVLQRGSEAPAAAPAMDRPRRVLVVEDDPAVAEAVETMIRALGFETSSARSAAEALKADLTGHDLVFSDVLMPGGMDGVELALRLRELHPGLPILLTSGYAGAPERVSQAGFPLLSKPYTEEAWLAAVQRLLKVGVGP